MKRWTLQILFSALFVFVALNNSLAAGFIIVDEAHHVLPESWKGDSLALPNFLKGLMFITVEPKTMNRKVLAAVDMVFAVGDAPAKIFADFADSAGIPAPPLIGESRLERSEILVWQIGPDSRTFQARGIPGQTQRRRHLRKYAEGDLGADRSFYFRGGDGKLNLKAQNLIIFMQIADGIDDKTWEYHLRRGDYSQWFNVSRMSRWPTKPCKSNRVKKCLQRRAAS